MIILWHKFYVVFIAKSKSLGGFHLFVLNQLLEKVVVHGVNLLPYAGGVVIYGELKALPFIIVK